MPLMTAEIAENIERVIGQAKLDGVDLEQRLSVAIRLKVTSDNSAAVDRLESELLKAGFRHIGTERSRFGDFVNREWIR